jgi:ATP-dependent Clp protease ATP-binding subunit ClpC
VDFTNTVLFLTSNLGANETAASLKRRVGFGGPSAESRRTEDRAVIAAARAALSPELYNRIDEVLVFAPLGRPDVREIARRLLDGLVDALAMDRGVRLELGDDVIDYLLDAGGFDPSFGARPMKRAIARLVEAPLADAILREELATGDVAALTVVDGAIVVRVSSDGAGTRVTAAE